MIITSECNHNIEHNNYHYGGKDLFVWRALPSANGQALNTPLSLSVSWCRKRQTDD